MGEPYIIVDLAHSFHGRLRRVHVPYRAFYVALTLFVFGGFSLFGFVSSYMRMTWKVANYNALRGEVELLRDRYQKLQNRQRETGEQLATMQVLAKEISIAYGLKRKLEGPDDIRSEGRLVPSVSESLEEYNLLKSANLSRYFRRGLRPWQAGEMPSLWPVNGRLQSFFGHRSDPFSGEGAFHTGVDLGAATGTPVHAAAEGVVVSAEWSGRYGKLVVLDHGNGLQTYYAHLSQFDVITGQAISRGEVLGLSGGTGRVTSPHLHYEVRRGGVPLNPYQFLSKSPLLQAAGRNEYPF